MNRYPREVNEAIWALAKSGKSIADIARALNDGEAGITLARPIPYETVRAKLRRLRLERGDAMSEPLHTEDVADTAEAIAQEFLTLARSKANQIRQATLSREIKPSEAQALDHLDRIISRHQVKPASQTTPASSGAKGGKSRGTATKSLLAQLARAEVEARSSFSTQQEQKTAAERVTSDATSNGQRRSADPVKSAS